MSSAHVYATATRKPSDFIRLLNQSFPADGPDFHDDRFERFIAAFVRENHFIRNGVAAYTSQYWCGNIQFNHRIPVTPQTSRYG